MKLISPAFCRMIMVFEIHGEDSKRMEEKNYYDILGVSPKASPDEITSAKNNLAKKYHPDANLKDGVDTTEQMQEILEAYRILSDPDKRAEYDKNISGRKAVLQTYDLHNDSKMSSSEEGFVTYWRASSQLYEIIEESDALYKQKDASSRLAQLALRALKPILLLRGARIPEKYWHPDIMNWLLFAWYKNRNYTTAYLLTLYDEHIKKDMSMREGMKLRSQYSRYAHSVKRLMKY